MIKPETIKAVRKDLEEYLQTLGERHGLLLELARIGGNKYGISAKISGNPLNEDKEPTGREAEIFRRMAHSKGMNPRWLGKTFRVLGQSCMVLGMAGSLGRMVKVKRLSDGRVFYVTPLAVQAGFLGAPPNGS